MSKEKDLSIIKKDFEERYKEEGLCDSIIEIALGMAYEAGEKSK